MVEKNKYSQLYSSTVITYYNIDKFGKNNKLSFVQQGLLFSDVFILGLIFKAKKLMII